MLVHQRVFWEIHGLFWGIHDDPKRNGWFLWEKTRHFRKHILKWGYPINMIQNGGKLQSKASSEKIIAHMLHHGVCSISSWNTAESFNNLIMNDGYPLVNVYITMENHHFSWVIQLYMAIFNSFLYVYQRVCGSGFTGLTSAMGYILGFPNSQLKNCHDWMITHLALVFETAGWFGTCFFLPFSWEESSSQLTNSYFSEGLKPPTRRFLRAFRYLQAREKHRG